VPSPLEEEARENSIAAWLKAHGASVFVSEPLAETDLSLEQLDKLARVLSSKELDIALQYVSASFVTCRLAREIEEAASRVYNLVGEVKGFTQMDRASVPGPVDIGKGLANTITVLRDKARAKSASVTLDVEAGLPHINAFGGELNQVWTNLIDNAIDAVKPSGRVEVTAVLKGEWVEVRVIDDGPGIPASVDRRVFEPFFTTKPVGAGTGLGLDIARQFVQRNSGEIDFESRPGRTEFIVRLPVAGAGTPGAGA
jgi:signal transduction histidine kinase